MSLAATSPVVFDATQPDHLGLAKADASTAVVVFQDVDEGLYHGRTLSLLGAIGAQTALGGASSGNVVEIEFAKLFTAYRATDGQAEILSVSGSTITPGTAVQFDPSDVLLDVIKIAITSSTAGVITYRVGSGGTRHYLAAFTFSGTTVTPVAPVAHSFGQGTPIGIAGSQTVNRSLYVYHGASNAIYGQILTGTTEGTLVALSGSYGFDPSTDAARPLALLSDTQAVLVFRDGNNNNIYAVPIVVNFPGNTLTWGTPLLLEAGGLSWPTVAFTPDGVTVAYVNSGGDVFVETLNLTAGVLTKNNDGINVSNSGGLTRVPVIVYLSSYKSIVVWADGSDGFYSIITETPPVEGNNRLWVYKGVKNASGGYDWISRGVTT